MNLSRLYDKFPNGEENLLLDTMKQLKITGLPWEKVFSEQVRCLLLFDTYPDLSLSIFQLLRVSSFAA